MDTMAPPRAPRDVGPALGRGLRRRCPACGRGALFTGYLSVRDACPDCGEALHHHRADDAPAWATMLIVGHLMVPAIVAARTFEDVPVWAHSLGWPLVALALCLLLLPRIKGAVVGYQWAHRMHGFDD
ncbi:DUF983 domain-containing protein [Rubrimonas cliftonensis]|uniref:Uncharacterized conserved protein, DUF983 family n=1 Tax=Rubrimonas cliftonensis TaxID=89524 RepID=A0A1H4BZC5_9RHOB|nr:DUF983 domain-containing protein [Rubrimonas cliftonensis]SEA53423.1 Uncharacterized conserved protein, DUF983 family [Rubrimonas cliftonensis]